jgi:hypothetical protein
MFQHAMWGYNLFEPFSIPHALDGLFTFAALEFLSTGQFITTRECLGTLSECPIPHYGRAGQLAQSSESGTCACPMP